MAGDDDLSGLLPDPPPPRPARRDAAIEAAMLRFDGKEAPTPALRPAPRRARFGWPQAGALVTAGLVAVLSVPLWLSGDPRTANAPPQTPAAETVAPAEPDTQAPPPAEIAALEPRPAAPATPRQPPTIQAVPPAITSEPVPAEMAAPSAPPPMMAPAPAPEPMPAPAQSRFAKAEDLDEKAIVVTGSRVTSPGRARAAPRPDWQACTVDDSRADPAACKSLNPAIAAGVSQAWQGDTPAAIAAFDRAIARRPSATAYLNRGLAYAQTGDLTRAIADLDRAIRRTPSDARLYLHRSRLHQQNGNPRRAAADAARAAELDR